jgi:hypothetical protein
LAGRVVDAAGGRAALLVTVGAAVLSAVIAFVGVRWFRPDATVVRAAA